jgi:hypothetical protein
VSNPFSNWKPHDVQAHNERVAMRTARQHNSELCGEVVTNSDNVSKPVRIKCEADLHSQIFSECRRRGWIALHGSMSERTHRTLGEWDFTVIAEHPHIYFVECKTATGKLSPDQQAMIAHAKKLGWQVQVVRSMVEFLALL